MTKLLEKAFAQAVKLPKKEQDKLANGSFLKWSQNANGMKPSLNPALN